MAKTLYCETGPKDDLAGATIVLNGVLPEERLTPKMAARAARVAFGYRNGVTVWDNEYQHGYRLYKNTARKLSQS